jgi:hypothetical protein
MVYNTSKLALFLNQGSKWFFFYSIFYTDCDLFLVTGCCLRYIFLLYFLCWLWSIFSYWLLSTIHFPVVFPLLTDLFLVTGCCLWYIFLLYFLHWLSDVHLFLVTGCCLWYIFQSRETEVEAVIFPQENWLSACL